MNVRQPDPADIPELEVAEQRCFSDPWPGRFFVAELLAPARFQRLVEDADGRLIAYLFAAWQYLDLHVLKVATLPEVRRTGLGRQLMEMARDHARSCGGESVTLEVRPGNEAAVTLYRALGFAVVGRRPGYYQDGDDALIMTLLLSEE